MQFQIILKINLLFGSHSQCLTTPWGVLTPTLGTTALADLRLHFIPHFDSC